MKNKFRKALLEQEITLGVWLQIGHPACAEILAHAGFDWICIDLEHGAITIETLIDLCRTIKPFECAAVARVPANDPVWIRRSIDAGADGIIVPMVNTKEEAESAVNAAKYPPQGRRGYGFARANMYGEEFEDYAAEANEETALIVQIEHRDAVENIEAILCVENIDGLFIGPYDLSGSFGVPGSLEHPSVLEALEKYRTACRKKNRATGLHVVKPDRENVEKAIEEGYTCIALGLDTLFLQQGAREVLVPLKS